MSKSKLQLIPLNLIVCGKDDLREVDTKSAEYQMLVDNIRKRGVINPIAVVAYQEHDEEDPSVVTFDGYRIVDGKHRMSAATDAGLTHIEASVKSVEDERDLAIQQISGNLQRIVTTPAAFARKIQQLVDEQPNKSLAELADELNYKEKFLKDRLKLNKLIPSAAELVDAGRIKLSQADNLAKLPPTDQEVFLEEAEHSEAPVFASRVAERLVEIKQEQQGQKTGPREFAPIAKLRKISDVRDQIEAPKELVSILSENNIKTPQAAAVEALKWVLNLDTRSVAAQKAEWDKAEKAKAESQEARKSKNLKSKADALRKKLEEAEKELAAEEAAAE